MPVPIARYFGSAVLGLVALSGAARTAGPQAPRLELTYLANMGVLLDGGDRRIVIDGLHRGALAEYASVPPALLAALERAEGAFRSLALVLTTHRHLDHFDAGSVASRLRADSQVIYVAAQETVDSLFARTGLGADHPRVRGVVPPTHGTVRIEAGMTGLEILDLAHNRTPSKGVANVGFLVTVGGVRVLHVGDADPSGTNFEPHSLAERSVDVAIVPFWYFAPENAAVRRLIGARSWIATHVPPSDTAAVRRQVQAAEPRALVLTNPGERHPIR